MKRIPWLAVTVILISVTLLVQSRAWAQAEPDKRPGPAPVAQHPVDPTLSGVNQPGPAGMPVNEAADRLKAQVDSTMVRMDTLIKQSKELSASFAKLATSHHGADKSEILMMQRISDAMGSMAGEVRTTLAQYKDMIDDETASETGAMKRDVDGLNVVITVIAGEVHDAVMTLQRLQWQLGQG